MGTAQILADRGNALLEALGGFFILSSVMKLYRDKLVRGVSFVHIGFFTAWGWWNLFYYWAMASSFSWYASIGVTAVNSLYFAMLIYYVRKERPVFDAKKPYKGRIDNWYEYVPEKDGLGLGYVIVGRFVRHPDGLRYGHTSYVIKRSGSKIETLNSRYRLGRSARRGGASDWRTVMDWIVWVVLVIVVVGWVGYKKGWF